MVGLGIYEQWELGESYDLVKISIILMETNLIIWKDATVCTLIGKKESDHNLIRFDFCRQIGSKERSNKMEKTIQINLRRFG